MGSVKEKNRASPILYLPGDPALIAQWQNGVYRLRAVTPLESTQGSVFFGKPFK